MILIRVAMSYILYAVVLTITIGHCSYGQAAGSSSGCTLPRDAAQAQYCPVQCQRCFGGGGACHLPAGSKVALPVVRVACAPGHRLAGDQDSELVACDKGGWIGDFPPCMAQCPPLESDSVHARCYFGGREVDCGRPAMPRTTVTVECRPSHAPYPSLAEAGVYRRTITCRPDGKWSHSLPECKPVCGVSKGSSIVEATIVDGKDTPLGVFPWHAGLYERERKEWKYICGGSLITKRVVLTAAHCVILDKKDLQVAFAKYYSAWEKDEAHTIKRNVSDIRIPREFDFGVNTLAWDIALLLLSQPVQINSYVMPVCRDPAFAPDFSRNATGFVVGWGRTSDTGNNSEILQHNDINIVHHDLCTRKIPRVLAVDKFCGSRNKASVVQKGDSGGGLTVTLNSQHFILGIVSIKYDDISIFTNTSWFSHDTWVTNELTNFDQEVSKCPKDTFQCGVYGACLKKSVRCDGVRDCPDGTDEHGCTNIESPLFSLRPLDQPSEYPGGCRLPPQPDNGEYYSSGCMPGDTRPACRNEPGTSVTPRWFIKYSCNKGYVSSSPIFLDYSTCIDGQWKNPIHCIKLCPALRLRTRELACTEGGFEVTCEKPARPGTAVTAACGPLTFDPVSPGRPAEVTCLDSGKWSHPIDECTTECGMVNNDSGGGLGIGVPSKIKEFPWSSAIFKKSYDLKWEQQCVGTLITTRLVITAASCLKNDRGRTLEPEDVRVVFGKYYRDIETSESYSVISGVKHMELTSNLSSMGSSSRKSGVGLIVLDVNLDVTPYVMPACVSWASPLQVVHGYIGHLAAWDAAAGALVSTKMVYVDHDVCASTHIQATIDSFCANKSTGYNLDLRSENVDGAGMTVVKDNRHFLIGVLTNADFEEIAGFTYSLFSDVAGPSYLSWLSEQRAVLGSGEYTSNTI